MVVASCRFQRSREVQFIKPVTFHAASPVSLLYVGCTVLDAPRLSDRRGGLAAFVQRDQPHPRLIRCARLASITPRMQSRGRSPRSIVRREGTATAAPYAAAFVSLTPVGGGVLDAPRSRDRRAALDPSVRRDRQRSHSQRRARRRPPPHASYPAGAAHAPFVRAHRRPPSTHAGRASSPARRRCGVCKRTGLRTGPFVR